MKAAEYNRVRELFLAVRALEPVERSGFLKRAAAGETSILEAVVVLLAEEERNPSFLEAPALDPGFREDVLNSVVTAEEEKQLERIGPFRIRGLLGEGGFSRVYAADQETPVRRRVAIKVLKPGIGSREVVRRFEAERQALALMDHPNITTVFEAGTTPDGRPYFVMEHIDGHSVTEYCTRRELSIRRRLNLLRTICSAVQHAHTKGVIHRDLKPTNILVAHGERGPVIKIIDFGIAKAVGPVRIHDTLHTLQGQVIGTIAYMSPEQISGKLNAVDVRTDIYALGVLLFEIVTGCLPHDLSKRSLVEAARMVSENEPPLMGSLDRSLRGDLETIAAKALARDPADRYQTASEFSADLRHYLNREAIAARSPTLLYQLRKLAARHRAVVVGVCLLGLMAVASFVTVVRAERRAQAQYTVTKEMADFLLSDVLDDLARLPGTADVRRSLLSRILSKSSEFFEAHLDDPGARANHARALSLLGELECEQGNLATALRLREQALEIRMRLQHDHAENPDYRAALSISLVKVGDVFKARGQLGRALEWYEQALDIDEALVEEAPNVRKYKNNLSLSYERMGWIAQRRGDLGGAETWYLMRKDLASELLAGAPNDLEARHGLYAAESLLSTVARARGASATTLEHVYAALAHAQFLAKRAPHDREFARCLVGALRQVGIECLHNGRLDEARRHFDTAVSRAEALLELDGDDHPSVHRVVMAYVQRASFLAQIGAMEEAHHESKRALEVAQGLHNAQGDAVDTFRHLARCHALIADLAQRLGDDDQARLHAEQNIAIRRRLAEPADATLSDILNYSTTLLRAETSANQNPVEALRQARRAESMADPDHIRARSVLASALHKNGQSREAIRVIENLVIALPAETHRRSQFEKLLQKYRDGPK